MAFKDVSVILLMILFVSFTCAETAESVASTNVTNLTTEAAPSAAVNTTLEKLDTASQAQQQNPANSSQICVRVKFDLEFNLTYTTIDNNASQVRYNISTDKDALKNVTTTCDKSSQSWTNQWDKMFTMTFQFKANNKSQYMLSEINLLINVNGKVQDAKANQTVNLSYHPQNEFLAPIGKSYRCDTRNRFVFKYVKDANESSNGTVTVTVSKMQLEAFRQDSKDEFSPSLGCEVEITSNVVLISVVCSLLAVIVLALVGYIIWYKRTQAQADLSTRLQNLSK